MADSNQEQNQQNLEELLRLACASLKESKWKGFTRPLGFIFVLVLFAFLIIADGNIGDFHVRDAWIPLLESVIITYLVAYIGSRGVEKTVRIFKGTDIVYMDKIRKRLGIEREDAGKPTAEDEDV